ncbi:MAG: hypothetical protein AAF528_11590 [Cyanobacteria bacterium P01_C01_bin.121]
MYPLESLEDVTKDIQISNKETGSHQLSAQLRRQPRRQPRSQARKRSASRWMLGVFVGSLALAASLETVGVIFTESETRSVKAQTTRLPARDPEQVPTARYGRGEDVDLSLIVEEWRDRYPAIPVYTCSCTAETCGDESVWPFRSFTLYQPFLALGAFNAAKNEDTGFNCFDIETGERP